ncbi:MAG: hypothetical protein U5K38_02095 [Woeseiaceae bacterium]|nr:hypothetical protein [Woeseiaceae bacterium]
MPAVTMSRGGIGGDAHSPDEWWENVDVVTWPCRSAYSYAVREADLAN